MTAHLKKLDLLMLAQQKLRGLAPVRRVLPTMLDQTRRVTVDLERLVSVIVLLRLWWDDMWPKFMRESGRILPTECLQKYAAQHSDYSCVEILRKKSRLTLEQLSHLNIVPLFLPVLVTLIPAPLISVFVGGVAEASSGTVFSSAASCFGIMVASPVKDVAVWGTPGGGGDPESESVAKEDRAAAAVWSITGLKAIYWAV